MITFYLNDEFVKTDQHPATPLIDFLRLTKRLTGTKIGCREGDCGACTVLVGELVSNEIIYKNIASCLTPLANAHGKHIVTIEGAAAMDLNEIQKIFVEEGAIQCGFCTPGFILSLVGFALGSNEINLENAKLAIAGNICRCTGYKAIERAVERITALLKKAPKKNRIPWLVKNNIIPDYFLEAANKIPTIPFENGKDQLIGGGTDLLVQKPEALKKLDPSFITREKNLSGISIKDDICHIGATTTHEELLRSKELEKAIPNIKNYLKLVSSQLIRNMATVAGNLVNASPIADLGAIFMALEAQLVLNKNGDKREIALSQFYIDYKKNVMEEGEFVESLFFRMPEKGMKLTFEKICKRTHLDMAMVNSAMKLKVKNNIIEDINLVIGGVAPYTLHMLQTNSFLQGKEINNQTFKQANEVAQQEIRPIEPIEYKRLLVRQQLFTHLLSSGSSKLTLEALQ